MARISISLPAELMARLDPIKDRINISQLCRESLERRVSAFERAAKNDGSELEIDELVARFQEEIVQEEGRFERLGQENAASWLGTAAYREFRSVVEARNISDMQKYRLPHAAFKTMKGDMEKATSTCDSVQAKEYKTAWLDFVRTVWTEVAAQLEREDAQEPDNGKKVASPNPVPQPVAAE